MQLLKYLVIDIEKTYIFSFISLVYTDRITCSVLVGVLKVKQLIAIKNYIKIKETFLL